MLALNTCQAREFIEVQDKVGATVKVKLNVSHINMPVNIGTTRKPYSIATQNESHQYSNARGIFEYAQNIKNFLSDADPTLIQGPLRECLIPFFQINC